MSHPCLSPDLVTLPADARETDVLYRSFQPLIHRLLCQYGEDGEMRQDLIGEIYLRFCVLLDAFDPERGVPLRGYLIRQLSASLHTYARSRWRQKRRETSLEEFPADLRPAGSGDPTPAWDDALLSREIAALLPQALGELSERQALLVVWRYAEGRSFKEIGETLGIKANSVRSLMRHALAHLRRWFEQREMSPHGV